MKPPSWLLCLTLATIVSPSGSLAADLAPRHVRAKPESSRLAPGLRADMLIVKFTDASRVRLREWRLVSLSNAPMQAANRLTVEAGDVTLSRLFRRPEAQLDADRDQAQNRSGRAMADLNGYYAIRLSEADAARAEALLDALNALDTVEIAYAEPIPENAAIDVTVPSRVEVPAVAGGTPDFTDLQDYHDPAPLGIGVAAAWAEPGGRGEGVKIIDIETGFRWTHEDMPTPFYEEGPASDSDHGVAVLGVLAAPDNGFGVVGIVHMVEVGSHVVLELPTATVFDEVASSLSPGDIFVIELQAPGPTPGGDGITVIPMEYYQANFDAIQTATANGVICVAAAGNGSADLDHPVYEGLFDRSVRDSGAIIIGATDGGSLVPASFSNHGTRVDLSGWGQDVVTTGYGDLFGTGPDDFYTGTFAGTSSATPIVTGAVAALQGIYRNLSGDVPLPGRTLADILIASGTPTAGPQLIGPRPDLAQAVPVLMAPLADLSGTVRDGVTSTPLEGALIRVLGNGAQTLTAAGGTWSLRLVPGTWTVRAEQFGYASSEYQVTVVAGGSDDRVTDLTLLPTVAVAGVVADIGGNPLPNAEVRIVDSPLAPVTTDSGGNYLIAGVPVPYEGVAHATLAGFAPDAREIVTTVLGQAPTDFRLAAPQFTFEGNDGGFTGAGDWEWGIPTFPEGPDCYGGLRCWGTALAGGYSPFANHQLTFTTDVPEFAPRLAYWHWYSIWGPWDGMQVSISSDGGANFDPLPPVGGYPNPCIWQLQDPCGPGWAEASDGWVPGVHDLFAYAGQTVTIRFLVTPSGFSTATGWYVDDLAVYQDTVQVVDTVCLEVEFDLPGGDPTLFLRGPEGCPTTMFIPSSIDVISGDLADVQIDDGEVSLGNVTAIDCGGGSRGYLVQALTPPEGEAVFYLMRKTGEADYGSSSSGLSRVPDSDDCP